MNNEQSVVTKYYAKYFAPGAFFGEDWLSEIESSDPMQVPWPDNAYAFRIMKREEIVVGEKTLKSELEPTDEAMYYHPDCEALDIEQAKAHPNATKRLIDNMECNKWSHLVVRKGSRWFQPFDPATDVILPRHEEV